MSQETIDSFSEEPKRLIAETSRRGWRNSTRRWSGSRRFRFCSRRAGGVPGTRRSPRNAPGAWRYSRRSSRSSTRRSETSAASARDRSASHPWQPERGRISRRPSPSCPTSRTARRFGSGPTSTPRRPSKPPGFRSRRCRRRTSRSCVQMWETNVRQGAEAVLDYFTEDRDPGGLPRTARTPPPMGKEACARDRPALSERRRELSKNRSSSSMRGTHRRGGGCDARARQGQRGSARRRSRLGP